MEEPFVPTDFDAPLAFAWSDFHLEPLGPQHNERDHEAWMSSIDHIRSTPGFTPAEEPNWPVAMSLERNLEDLVRHARDFEERKGFTYSILEGDDVVGCVYIYPSRASDHDAVVSSWVTESHANSDDSVRKTLATWIDEVWPFSNPHYAGTTSSATDLGELLEAHTEAWNSHDLDSLMSLFSKDCMFEASGGDEVCGTRYEGFEMVREAFAAVLDSMPDARWDYGRHHVLGSEYGVSEWTLTGTLSDGRRLEVNGCDFLTIRDGLIVLKNSYRKQRPPLSKSF
ncbi:MAG TPA: nuclear transport factor 2 family protein [Acidimicrobiia bacterium]